MKKYNHQKGITTIQTLVMFGIICLVVLFFMYLVSVERKTTRDNIRVANIKQIQASLEMFYSQNGSYPALSAKAVEDGSYHNWLPDLDDMGNQTNFAAFLSQKLIAPTPADSKDCRSSRPCNNDTGAIANDFCYTVYPAGCSASGNVKCNAYSLEYCTANSVGETPAGRHQITNNEIKSK
jgi:competence protein ComGC